MQPLLPSDVSYAADAWPSVVDFCVFGLFDELDLMCAASRAVGPVRLVKSFLYVKEFIR